MNVKHIGSFGVRGEEREERGSVIVKEATKQADRDRETEEQSKHAAEGAHSGTVGSDTAVSKQAARRYKRATAGRDGDRAPDSWSMQNSPTLGDERERGTEGPLKT